MSDRQFAETLAGVQDGEESAVSVLWRAHNPALVRFLRSRHAPSDIDDIASEVWLRASRSWHRFEGDERDFRAWFFSIARAVSVDSYRRAGRRRDEPVADVEPRVSERRASAEAGAFESLGTDRAISLLASLPREQGEAIALRVIAGLDAEHVGRIMGKRAGHRARAATPRAPSVGAAPRRRARRCRGCNAMSSPNDAFDDMDETLWPPRLRDPLQLDDGTVDRLLDGMPVDDAPPSYRGVAELLSTLTAPPSADELVSEPRAVAKISARQQPVAPPQAFEWSSPSPPRLKSTKKPTTKKRRRLRVSGAALVGSATLFVGLGAAGALPGAAQGVASDVLATVGVNAPNPDAHGGDSPDTAARVE